MQYNSTCADVENVSEGDSAVSVDTNLLQRGHHSKEASLYIGGGKYHLIVYLKW